MTEQVQVAALVPVAAVLTPAQIRMLTAVLVQEKGPAFQQWIYQMRLNLVNCHSRHLGFLLKREVAHCRLHLGWNWLACDLHLGWNWFVDRQAGIMLPCHVRRARLGWI